VTKITANIYSLDNSKPKLYKSYIFQEVYVIEPWSIQTFPIEHQCNLFKEYLIDDCEKYKEEHADKQYQNIILKFYSIKMRRKFQCDLELNEMP